MPNTHICGNLRIQPWLAFTAQILPPLAWFFRYVTVGNFWPEDLADIAADYIENEQYTEAQTIIDRIVTDFGESTETVSLSTRIACIEILAGSEGVPEVEAVIEDTYDTHYEIEVHDCPYCGDDHRHHIGHALADAEHIIRAECDGGLYRFTL